MTMPVLPLLHDEGEFFVVSAGNKKHGNKKKHWENKHFATLAEAEAWMAEQNGKRKRDVYIKHAIFDGARDQKGNPLTSLPHVVGSRCFFVDVDVVGEDPQYATEAEAKAAIFQAIKLLGDDGIPNPTLVQRSGGGFQIAWVMTEPMGLQAWRVDNGVLYSLLEKHGLKMDLGAASPERGIRLCGDQFFNWKTGTARQTKVLLEQPRIPTEIMRQALAPHRLTVVPFATPLEKQDDEYAVSVDYVWHVADSVDHCNVLRESAETRGADHSFHLWSTLVALAARDTDEEQGRAWAHQFSSGHEGYDAAEVDRKYDDFRRGEGRHTTCKRLGQYLPSACAACAYRSKVNSPAGLPKAVRETVAASLPALPDERYYNGSLGLMRKATEDDVVCWYGYHVSEVVLHEEPSGGRDQLSFLATTTNGGWRRKVTVEVAAMSDARSARRALSTCGVALTEANSKEVYGAMVAWITRLRADRKAQPSRNHLGWSGDDFVLADTIYSKGKVTKFIPDPALQDFVPRGDLQTYCAIANMVLQNEERPEVHAHLATALAAPLLKLTGVNGIVMNFHSAKSGFGKTTITKLAAGFWGKPERLILGIDDTHAATAKQLGVLSNLPGYYDDPRLDERYAQDLLGRLIFRAAHGSEKRRLTQTSAMQESGSWQTILIMASNSSLLGAIASRKVRGDATAARVLEFTYQALTARDQDNAAAIQLQVSKLEQNCGVLGPLYAQYLVDHRSELEDRLLRVNAALMPLTRTGDGDVSGRMQAAAAACLVVGASIAEQQGWLAIDSKLVALAVRRALRSATQARTYAQHQLNVEDVLDEYLRSNEAHRIITVTPSGGTGGKMMIIDHPHVARPVKYEIDTTARQMVVEVSGLYDWLVDKQHDVKGVLVGLKHYPQRSVPMARGTPLASPSRLSFLIPLEGRWGDLI